MSDEPVKNFIPTGHMEWLNAWGRGYPRPNHSVLLQRTMRPCGSGSSPLRALLASFPWSGFSSCFWFSWPGRSVFQPPGGVGRPCRLARKQGLQRPRREPELRLKSNIGVMKHGPGLGIISLGCAARASLVNTINSRTYKTINQVFAPLKLKLLLWTFIHSACSDSVAELRFLLYIGIIGT